jgi:hypothetical protein
LSSWGGFAVGLILNEAVMYKIEMPSVFWTTNGVCIICSNILTHMKFEDTIIYTSSILGSYSIVRGVSCFAGHYYNEFTIIKLLESGAIASIDQYYWAYVGCFILFSIFGVIYQYRTKPPP